MTLDELIKQAVQQALTETDNNRLRAALLLGISRSTLYRYLRQYKLAPESDRLIEGDYR